jgi:hypothetical protein
MVEALQRQSKLRTQAGAAPSQEPADVERQDLFGVWSDLPDTMLDELDRLRHTSQLTPLQEPANVEWQDLFGAWSNLGADYETN